MLQGSYCEQLVGEVKENRYYSILADEATDCSMKEQLALIFRFVDKKKTTLGKNLYPF